MYVIDELIFDNSGAAGNHSLCKIDTTHYFLAYQGENGDGIIKTFSIDSDGDNITEIDSLIFYTTTDTLEHSLALIDSTHVALFHTTVATGNPLLDNIWIRVFSFDGSYSNLTEVSSLDMETGLDTDYGDLTIVKLDGSALAVAYKRNGGRIATVTFDGSYNLTLGHNLLHDSSVGVGSSNHLLRIDDTHLFLAYTGRADGLGPQWLELKTFSVDGSYNLTEVDNWTDDPDNFSRGGPCVAVDSTHFLVFSDSNEVYKTFVIDGSYNISFVAASATNDIRQVVDLPDRNLVQLDSTHYALTFRSNEVGGHYEAGAYPDVANGAVETVSLDGSYNIQIEELFTHVDTTRYHSDSPVAIDDTKIIVAFSNNLNEDDSSGNSDGVIRTIYTAPSPKDIMMF